MFALLRYCEFIFQMRLIVSADAPINDLFATGAENEYDKHHQRIMAGDLNYDAVLWRKSLWRLNVYSGKRQR